MSEFIWRNQIKVICCEITRGAQFEIWHEVQRRGLLSMNEDGAVSLDNLEGIAEVVTVYATQAVYECEKSRWKEAHKVFDVALPMTPEAFKSLPASFANGWIESALKDNPLLAFINFPSASGKSTPAGSEAPSDSTP